MSCRSSHLRIVLWGLALLGTAATRSRADDTIDPVGRPESTTSRVAGSLDKHLFDWHGVFLTEFAVGGPVEAIFEDHFQPFLRNTKCRHCAAQDVIFLPGHGFRVGGFSAPVAWPAVPWKPEDVFAETTTTNHDSAVGEISTTGGAANKLKFFVGETETAEQPCRLPLSLRPGEAAAEILHLRRAIGMNPLMGTMLATTGYNGTDDSTTDCPAADEPTDEEAIAATIRELEQYDAAEEAYAVDFAKDVPDETVTAFDASQLRSAEKKLEEAAAVLENAGDYDRADAIRALAQDVRFDARRAERDGSPHVTRQPRSQSRY